MLRVDCNQADIIKWLVKNNIGFCASCHYGHITYLFHENDDYIMAFKNLGFEVETYYQNNNWNEIINSHKKLFYKIPLDKIDENT